MTAVSGGGDPFPFWEAEKIRTARFLVVGAGALGNEVIKNLALMGAIHVYVVDFDHVESHNLAKAVLFRQEDAEARLPKIEAIKRHLQEISPEIQLNTLFGDVCQHVSSGLVRQMDVVIGCVDNRLARLAINRLCWQAGVPWVEGGIFQLSGQVNIYVPGHSCYECQLSESDWKDIRTRIGCVDIIQRYQSQGRLPTTSISASIIGAIQVQEALRLIFLPPESRRGGTMFSYEGMTLASGVYDRLGLKEECLSHHDVNEILPIQAGHTSTVGELVALLRDMGLGQDIKIRLRQDLVTELVMAEGSQKKMVLPRLAMQGALLEALERKTGKMAGIGKDGFQSVVSLHALDYHLPLWRLGLAFGEELSVFDGQKQVVIRLELDLQWLNSNEFGVRIPNPWLDTPAEELAEMIVM